MADASHGAEIAVLTGANLLATLVRFVLFKAWVFRARRRPSVVPRGTAPAEAATEALPVVHGGTAR